MNGNGAVRHGDEFCLVAADVFDQLCCHGLHRRIFPPPICTAPPSQNGKRLQLSPTPTSLDRTADRTGLALEAGGAFGGRSATVPLRHTLYRNARVHTIALGATPSDLHPPVASYSNYADA